VLTLTFKTIVDNLPLPERTKQLTHIFNKIYMILISGQNFDWERIQVLKKFLIDTAADELQKTILYQWYMGKDMFL